MLEQLREQIRALLDERAKAKEAADAALAKARAENRAPTPEEAKAFAEARAVIKGKDDDPDDQGIDGKIAAIETQLKALEAAEKEDEAANARAQAYGGAQPIPVKVTNEPDIYRPGGPHSFIRDAYRAWKNPASDPQAFDRITRHQAHTQHLLEKRAADAGLERRDVGTSAFGSLVVPQFLVDEFAEVARDGRVTANLMRPVPLPDEGMTLTIPRGTTGTRAMSQTAEGDDVHEQDFDETDLEVPVRTIAGQQDVSRQSIDRGRGVDLILMGDLIADYHNEQDRQVIEGTGSAGEHWGLLSTTGRLTVTVVSTNPIVQWRQLADAIQRINTQRKRPATHIIMSPRRWGAFSAATDSQGRPLVLPNPNIAQNPLAIGEAAAVNAAVGTAHGLPVFVDGNSPIDYSSTTSASTQEDVILVVRASDHILAESQGGPMAMDFEETLAGALKVKIVVWDYSAFTAGRYPTAVAVLAGTGMTTPSFTS